MTKVFYVRERWDNLEEYDSNMYDEESIGVYRNINDAKEEINRLMQELIKKAEGNCIISKTYNDNDTYISEQCVSVYSIRFEGNNAGNIFGFRCTNQIEYEWYIEELPYVES